MPPPRPWIFAPADVLASPVDEAIERDYLADEARAVEALLEPASGSAHFRRKVKRCAIDLVEKMRRNRRDAGGIDAFMAEYDLSSSEGIVLLCLAEALLRIPDADTADRLIADKLAAADWRAHLQPHSPVLVNASTWALMLTGRVLEAEHRAEHRWQDELARTIGRLGEPLIRTALKQAMRILGHQFVMGRTIESALRRARRSDAARYRYSFDMLGEAALTAEDATRYFEAYSEAIAAIGRDAEPSAGLMDAPGISVKLSALSARFEFAQGRRVVGELAERLAALASAARDAGIALTVDAEEADRLEPTLAVFAAVLKDPRVSAWPGLGLAVQAYQKRAYAVLAWLEAAARESGRSIPVRLVKGAYWDSEIKQAQALGLSDYPVFTRKCNTDLSYLACAARLLDAAPCLYPQFATHNAHTVAWVLERGGKAQFEFQRLHGMGEELYREIIDSEGAARPCRVYAPVGSHEDLLPYLVRRLLENGANTSFVNRFVHAEVAAAEVVQDPLERCAVAGAVRRHPRIPLPRDLFQPERRNACGANLAAFFELRELATALEAGAVRDWRAAPVVGGVACDGERSAARDPADSEHAVGEVVTAGPELALAALDVAARAQAAWGLRPVSERSGLLRAAADAFEAHRGELLARCVREGGRTVADSLAELREAVDLLRYYAAEADRLTAAPRSLPGVTGESNLLYLKPRGVFLCISPWNFPLSIFTGQVAAALAAGNSVLAKPAEQTGLVAARAVELMLAAGIPAGVLQFLPGDGASIATPLLCDSRLAGVAFTGSTETAAVINRRLAARDGPIATLIAETGGINAMIADSSALAEQLVKDAAQSAFNSAGQRCSALRLLCLQEDTADRVLELLIGHMRELVIGDPCLLSTDVGPVIDSQAKQMLDDYVQSHSQRILYQCRLCGEHERGAYVAPTLLELEAASDLTREIFGPVLHVTRYAAGEALAVVDALNAVGYGLTLGVHSRVESFAKDIAARARVGNVYVNRNMIGAQVGAQPFGGMGYSGTGPKAGGPHYLERFMSEQAVTINTAAVGGNATLYASTAGGESKSPALKD
jgi:RHH-type proline utilization regulon transcriptional repressor/proline dehydrogenase/delta 1-pyrroline-5-carboxylate dehydrogenase